LCVNVLLLLLLLLLLCSGETWTLKLRLISGECLQGNQGKKRLERSHLNNYGCKEESVRSKGRETVTVVWTLKRMPGNRLPWRTGT
jgi:hypothetical protein